MKRIIIISILAAILLSLCSCDTKSIKKADIIRIHIRANSNSSEDQEIKYIVKDSIVEYITPLSNEVSTKAEMYKLLSENMDSILETAEATLESEGYEYGANIRLDKEMFPLRSYDGVTFESGEYDALIIEGFTKEQALELSKTI